MKCGDVLGPDVMLAEEKRCRCGHLFLDPFRGLRRLYKKRKGEIK
jgi:hypothetical protein